MVKGSCVLYWFVLLVAPYAADCKQQHTVPVSKIGPSQVINLGDIIRRDIGLSGLGVKEDVKQISITHVSQAGGVWAAVVPFAFKTTVLATGRGNISHAFTVSGRVRQLAVDQEGRLHLLERSQVSSSAPDIWVMDESGASLEHYSLSVVSAVPFLSDSGVLWKAPDAIVAKQLFIPLLQLNGKRDSNELIPQVVTVGALSDHGYFTFGNLSEVITVHGPDGSVLRSYPAPLDSAYEAIGVSFGKPPQPSEISRVMWAASTGEGLLYVCLSGTLGSGPAFLAVIEASSGTLQRVVSAELPGFKDGVAANNPAGTMLPATGAIGDQLVIADRSRGVLAIY
jgi:hypothetical protein